MLLLDEPTRNFSPLSGPVVRKALKTLAALSVFPMTENTLARYVIRFICLRKTDLKCVMKQEVHMDLVEIKSDKQNHPEV